MVEKTSKENKVKRMKRNEDSFRDLWDNIKHTNIWIIGVPEEELDKAVVCVINWLVFCDYGHGGEVWQNVVHWRREWQTTSVFLTWEPHEEYEKAKW